MTVLRGTSLAIPSEKERAFRFFLLEGQAWVAWRGTLDVSACGRQLRPGSPEAKFRTLRNVFAAMQTLDPVNAQAYAGYLSRNLRGARNELVGYRYYWRSEYGIFRRPEWFVSLKMASARVVGTEVLNNENRAGRYLADGVLLLYRRGDEYSDIFPVWDWRHLPGTTVAWEPSTPQTGGAQDRLVTTWVGGASDGESGCAVLDYDRDQVRARKAWFFRNDVVVCLGNGITGDLPIPVHTTLNQCWLRGSVKIDLATGDLTKPPTGKTAIEGVRSIEHDGITYCFFSPTSVDLSSGEQSGQWSTVFQNPATPLAPVSAPVFNLWINHGVRPRDASYAWSVMPTNRLETLPKVLSNSSTLQAVQWSQDEAQIAFWRAGKVEVFSGEWLTASVACIVLVKRTADNDWQVSVSDPSQGLRNVALHFQGTERVIDFPMGALVGSTASRNWRNRETAIERVAALAR